MKRCSRASRPVRSARHTAATHDRLLRDHREGTRFADVLEAAGVMDVLLVKESGHRPPHRRRPSRLVDRASAAEGYSDWGSAKAEGLEQAYRSRWSLVWRCPLRLRRSTTI